MKTVRYRLALAPIRRALRVFVLGSTGLFFVVLLFRGSLDLSWWVLCVVGLLSSIYGLRIVLGPAVEVRERGLRNLKNWPFHRDIPWYRMLEVDIVPGFWQLDIELNSGERIRLPCVQDMDDLYERIEESRRRLDA